MGRYEVRESLSPTGRVVVREGVERILSIHRQPAAGVYAHLTGAADASLVAKVERDASGTQFEMTAADGARLATLHLPPPIVKGPLLDVYGRCYTATAPPGASGVTFADDSGEVVMAARMDAGRVTIETSGELPREVAILAGFVVYDKGRV